MGFLSHFRKNLLLMQGDATAKQNLGKLQPPWFSWGPCPVPPQTPLVAAPRSTVSPPRGSIDAQFPGRNIRGRRRPD